MKTNLKQRQQYLDNLFSFEKLTSIFVRGIPQIKEPLTNAIEDYKYAWSEVPIFQDLKLDLDSLRGNDEYEYLKDINFVEYDKCIVDKSPKEVSEEFIESALSEGLSLMDIIDETQDNDLSRKPLVGLDLETTGLDFAYLKVGGKTIHTCYITGMCISYISPDLKETAIYIPTMNTEADGVPNLEYSIAIKILERLHKEATLVYHNANYDREVCSLNGAKIGKIGGFFDTLQVVKQTDFMLQEFPKLGLKPLSEEILERPYFTMSEMNAKEVGFHNLAFKHLSAYGSLDAANTLALFRYFVEENPDIFKVLTIHQLDAKSMDTTSVMNRRGYPADIEYIQNAMNDTARRELLMYETFADLLEKLGITEDIYITKTEAISRQLISIYIDNFTAFVKKKTNIDIDIWNDDDALQKFMLAVESDLNVVIKKKVLKDGSVKLTHSMDIYHLQDVRDNIEGVRWMEPTQAEYIYDLCQVLRSVSSVLQNTNSYYKPFLKSITYDDTGYYKLPVALKFGGTVTTRYSNKGGKPTTMEIVQLKTKTNYNLKIGAGLCGVNAQGIPSGEYKLIEAKKILNITKFPNKILNQFKVIKQEVKEYVQANLL